MSTVFDTLAVLLRGDAPAAADLDALPAPFDAIARELLASDPRSAAPRRPRPRERLRPRRRDL